MTSFSSGCLKRVAAFFFTVSSVVVGQGWLGFFPCALQLIFFVLFFYVSDGFSPFIFSKQVCFHVCSQPRLFFPSFSFFGLPLYLWLRQVNDCPHFIIISALDLLIVGLYFTTFLFYLLMISFQTFSNTPHSNPYWPLCLRSILSLVHFGFLHSHHYFFLLQVH